MATPGMPENEPFAEAGREAVQTAVMAVRLVLAIADAVRRHQQRADAHPLPPEQAMSQAAGDLKQLMPADISAALTASADWPHLAQKLVALQHAGVDLQDFLPQVGRIAVTVRDSVAANAARVAREGTGDWEKLLRETLPAGPVREAILASPTWPDIAATMARLDERGVDVRQLLAAAHDEGDGVDQAVAKVLAAEEVPTTSRDAMLSYGPMTTGLDIPKDLDLTDRARALRQLAISPRDNERFTRLVREAMPGREREADLLFTAKQWPLVAARMAHMESTHQPLKDHLVGLMNDTSWEQGPGAQLGSRLVQATTDVLLRPPGAATSRSGAQVSTAAARSLSSTVGPTRAQRPTGAASAQRGVAPHREAAPAAQSGKAR
ncbi:hypothetical protein [Streptomyces sp. NPDC058745]|uniref:hypothetical protein n=1 Tax=Streptomyces sp. NPDC058745 TaxID=3346621 RepID=UPI0036774DCE